MSDNVLLTFLAEVAFALAVILLLVSLMLRRYIQSYRVLHEKYKSLRRQIKVGSTVDRTQPKKNDGFFDNPLGYVKRQLSHTDDKKSDTATASSDVWHLRQKFLNAEASALKYNEDSDAYWKELDNSLTTILKQLTKKAGQDDIAYWQNKVELLRERLNRMKASESQERYLQQQLKSANKTIQDLKTKQARGLNRDNMNKICQINTKLKRTGTDTLVVHHRGVPDPLYGIQKSNGKDLADSELIKTSQRSQREIIRDLKQNVDTLSSTGDSNQYQGLKNKIDSLEDQLEKSESYSSKLETELVNIKKTLDQAQHNLEASEKRLEQTDQEFWRKGRQQEHRDTLVISSTQNSSDEDDLNSAHECYQRASEDISEINKVIEYQRTTITGLEDEISNLRSELLLSSDPDESEEKARIISRLEQLLNESETCVKMLEDEVDTLRDKLNHLSQTLKEEEQELERAQHHIHDLEDTQPTTPSNSMEEELDNMAEMLNNTMCAYGDQSCITHFAMNCLKCRDLNELARDIMDTAANFGVDTALIIRSKLGQVETADQHKINNRDKQQLRAIVFDENNRVTDISEGFIIAFPNISLLVKPHELNSEQETRNKDLLVSLLSLASHAIEKIESDQIRDRQKKTLDTLLRSTQKTIKSLDIQYTYQCDEATKINDRLLKDLYLALETMKISNNQRKLFERMMNDSQERMALLFASGLTVDDTMKKLISRLESN
ncbi:hypothetical protein R50073_46530 [Maricurvus nonylphenolicus]|uniref:hypothetical protein n=1 Tax=Maricurvus nonylphenolicus TaxID=1008307 RepID=UPI0036F39EF5